MSRVPRDYEGVVMLAETDFHVLLASLPKALELPITAFKGYLAEAVAILSAWMASEDSRRLRLRRCRNSRVLTAPPYFSEECDYVRMSGRYFALYAESC